LQDTEALLADIGLSDWLSDEGCLSLYADAAEFKVDRDHIEILERFGIPHDILSGQSLRELEPELSERIGMAVRFPQNRSIRDPYRLVMGLADRFTALGGRIERGAVAGFTRSDRITGVVLADGRHLSADTVVIAAGAYSGKLSARLGEPIPLETERGYHTQIMAPGISLQHSIIWPARAFMVTPTAGGLRVGGTVEMAGLEAAPDYRRAKVTVRRAMEALPNLQSRETSEWMGHRPALPDTVPILSASARTAGVFYATGHGHLGLTLAATTARVMGELIAGAKPALDLHPYRINRF
jgi:D-amino-acid dehydrogenase